MCRHLSGLLLKAQGYWVGIKGPFTSEGIRMIRQKKTFHPLPTPPLHHFPPGSDKEEFVLVPPFCSTPEVSQAFLSLGACFSLTSGLLPPVPHCSACPCPPFPFPSPSTLPPPSLHPRSQPRKRVPTAADPLLSTYIHIFIVAFFVFNVGTEMFKSSRVLPHT